MNLTRAEIKIIVEETLSALGFDLREPQQAQADMIFLRKFRIGSESMTFKMRLSITGLLISAGAYIFMMGIRAFLGK